MSLSLSLSMEDNGRYVSYASNMSYRSGLPYYVGFSLNKVIKFRISRSAAAVLDIPR